MRKKYWILTLFMVSLSLQAQTLNKVTLSKVKHYQTSKASKEALRYVGEKDFMHKVHTQEKETNLFVSRTAHFQSFIGIGGALTDASAETFYKMPKDIQQSLLKAYYDKSEGIAYTLGRTHINSCDFSSDSYSYVQKNDSSLKSFSVAHDLKYRIPFIQQAIAAANGHLTLFVSPWSPPAWMKDNQNMLQGGKLLPQYRQTWANYFVAFIKAYEQLGIPVWGMTVQNEPQAVQTWESCIYTATEEKDFVKYYLGPTLEKAGMVSKKIIIWDHNRDIAFQRADDILSDPEAAKYIWGTGFHWYEDWSGGQQQYQNIQLIYEAYPAKNLLFTEGCVGPFALDKINDWTIGERYGESMINDFNAGAVGWTDWNILLDEQGGPNHVKNFCYAPIHYNSNTKQLIYTNSYYYIGHFSKFIRPGAKRIAASSSKSFVSCTAFENTDGSIVLVALNKQDKAEKISINIEGKSVLETMDARSIATFVIE